MQISIKKKDVIWNYIGTFFNMGSNYIQLPFLLFFLPSDVLGLWYVFMSLSAISNLITFGFTPSFSRSVAYCWSGAKVLSKEGKNDSSEGGARDYHLLVRVISTCKRIYLIMACIATLLLASVGTIYVFSISKEIWNTNILIGWILFLIAVFINLYYGYYSALVVGVGGIKENNQAITIANIMRVIFLGGLLFIGTSIAGATLAFLMYGMTLRFICKRFFEKITSLSKIKKELNIVVSKEEIKETFETLWHNAWRDGMVSVSDYVSTQAGTIICSTFLSLELTGIYSITSQIVVAVAKISRSIDNAHLPVIQSAFVNNDKKKAKHTQTMCVSGYVMTFLFLLVIVAGVGIPILRIFKADLIIDMWLYLGLAIYQFLISFRNCYAAYLSCTNRLWYWKSYIIASAICLLGEVILFKMTSLGVWSIVVASVLSELIYNAWHWMLLVNNELEIVLNDYIIGAREFIMLFIGRKQKSK